MSALTTHPEPPAPSRPAAPRLPRIKPPKVRQDAEPGHRRALGSLPFVLLVGGLLAAGLLSLLMVNNSLAAGSFEQTQLRADLTLLGEQEQALTQEVQRASSPTQLRAAAKALGMVPAATTTYFDPVTGTILGTPLPSGTTTVPGTLDPGVGVDPGTIPPTGDGVTMPGGDDGTGAGAPGADPAGPGGDSATTTPDAPTTGTNQGDGAAPQPGPAPTTAYDRAIVSGGDQ